jgi:hypothetical protein
MRPALASEPGADAAGERGDLIDGVADGLLSAARAPLQGVGGGIINRVEVSERDLQ